MKVAVIGCGYWGKNLVRNFYELGVLGAIFDANEETSRVFSQEYKVPALSVEAIAKDPHIEAVVIAAPAPLHYQLAKNFLLAGKDIFVEKPLTLDQQEAKELIDIAAKGQRILMVGHVLNYHPAFEVLKKTVQDGEIGKVLSLTSSRLSLGKLRTEEDVWWSFAPHDISMILALAGQKPQKIFNTGEYLTPVGKYDSVRSMMTFANGCQAHIHTSWWHHQKTQSLVVVGSKGTIVFDDTKPWDQKIALYRSTVSWKGQHPEAQKQQPEFLQAQEKEPLREECLKFIEAIETRVSPITDGCEGLAVLEILEAGSRSLAKGQPVELNCDVQEYFLHESSYVDAGVRIGKGTKIWHFSHILGNVDIGQNVVISQNVMIGPDVKIGDNCKIQNNVSLYKGTELGRGVFCGPSCVFTNVNTPRAEIERKDAFLPTYVEDGVTIGANATIVCGNTLGAHSFIAAGAVVTKSTKPHAMVAGVPARQIGWVSHAGEKLGTDLVCPREGRRYKLVNDTLQEIL